MAKTPQLIRQKDLNDKQTKAIIKRDSPEPRKSLKTPQITKNEDSKQVS